MANVSFDQAIADFEEASIGDPTVRQTLIDLLDTLNSVGGNVKYLNVDGVDRDTNYFVRYSQVYSELKKTDAFLKDMPEYPSTEKRGKCISSGNLYKLLKSYRDLFNSVNGPEKVSKKNPLPNDTLADACKILNNTKDLIMEAIQNKAGGSTFNHYTPTTPHSNPWAEGLYEKHGSTYELTEDTTIVQGKTYYKAKEYEIDSDTPFEDYPEIITALQLGASYSVEPLEVTEKKLYEAPEGVAYNPLNVKVRGNGGNLVATENNKTYVASDDGYDYYETVTVNVAGGAESTTSSGYSGGSSGGGSSSGGEGTVNYAKVTPNGDENPKRMGWFEKSGTKYVKTTDTEVDPSKTYYEETTAEQFNLMTLETDELGEYDPDPGYDGFNCAIVQVKEFPVDPFALFTVTFVDENGNVLEKHQNVHYTESVAYNGVTPTKGSEYNDFWTFKGWNPTSTYVTCDMVCRPVFILSHIGLSGEIEDSWEKICNNRGSDYRSGQWKPMRLKDNRIIRFMKVGDGEGGPGGRSTSAWLAMDSIGSGVGNLVGGWPNCTLRQWLNDEGPYLQNGFIKNYIPDGIAESIKKVTKYSAVSDENSYSEDTPVKTYSSTDKIWIPSARETYVTIYYNAGSSSATPSDNIQRSLKIENNGPVYTGGGLNQFYDIPQYPEVLDPNDPTHDLWSHNPKIPFMFHCGGFDTNFYQLNNNLCAITPIAKYNSANSPTRTMITKNLVHGFNEFGKGSLDDETALYTDPHPDRKALSTELSSSTHLAIGFCL